MKAIIYNTFIELIKNKIFYLISLFVFILLGATWFISTLSIVWESKVLLDFWLGIIEVFWLIITIFIWSQLIYNEIEWKTIILLLTKPINATKFIFWKFISFSLFLFIIMSFVFSAFLLIFFLKWWIITIDILIAWLFIYYKLLILISFLLLFGALFTLPIFSIIWTIIMYLAWSWTYYLVMASRKTWLPLHYIHYALPNLEILNLKNVVSDGIKIIPWEFFYSSAYTMIYSMLILLIAIFIFRKREF